MKGGRAYNPGWNLATDLPVHDHRPPSRVAQGALNRKESRGGHTREDYPGPDPELGKVNFVQRQTGEHGYLAPIAIAPEPLPEMPAELRGTARGGKLSMADAEKITMRVWRGDDQGGEFTDYVMPAVEGEVVLDVIHRIQATDAPDLACRWNCKAGKCGSCSAEINGLPRLMCMTRMDTLPEGEPVTVAPMKTFPIIRDLVTDVSFNYEVAKTVPAFEPGPEPEGGYRMVQVDVERGQEFRKCIECFMCQDVCHVIRDHEENKPRYAGPRFFIRFAELEMHPLDTNDRRELAHERGPRHVQHHQVLHRGLPRAHQDHRQRHHPDEGARGRRPLRPGRLARAQDHGTLEEDRRGGDRRGGDCWLSGAAAAGLVFAMARYLSPEWVLSFDAALSALDLSDVVAAAAEGSLAAADGTFSVVQVVTGVPTGGPAADTDDAATGAAGEDTAGQRCAWC